ncbi:MAG TPA: DUF3368 domain-containing protein, partial [Thermomicrobiales bacterium]|nr:DUF3368 domain-containing protein [Thermomicrobiales bacterium]
LPEWITIGSPRATASGLDDPALGRGERAALSLAVELRPTLIVLDDWRARRMAARLSLPVIGTTGLLAVAKQEGLFATIRPYLETLIATGFRLAPEVIESALRRAGEGSDNEPRSMRPRHELTDEDD